MIGSVFAQQEFRNNEYKMLEARVKEESIISLKSFKVEPISYSSSDSSENFSNDEETHVSPIPFTTPYKIKDPIVLLERCDKIWDTLKLIKNVQDTQSSLRDTSSSYIKYVPVLGNDNAALPNFQFSVKFSKKIYSCLNCGKLYTHKRSLQNHMEKVHDEAKYANTEEDYGTVGRDKSNHVKVHSKEDTSELDTEPSVLSSPSSMECTQSVKRRKFSPVHDSNHTSCNESMTTEETIELLKKMSKQNYNSDSCLICKKSVQNIKKHLTDNHKIESYGFMPKDSKESGKKSNNEYLKHRKTIAEFRSNSVNPTRQCDVCFGIYAVSGIHKHVQLHQRRGETKENYHLLKNNFVNSPLFLNQKTVTTKESSDNASNNIGNVSKCREKRKLLANKKGEENCMVNVNNNENVFTTRNKIRCRCEKIFRNPYSLFVHKKHCNIQTTEVTQPNMKVNSDETDQHILQNSCDGDSGIGISITIKKKNNTYEVISKDSTKALENSKEWDASSDISEDYIDPQDELLDNLESSKYSENHSILRIQSVEEDIEVDIEEDSQCSFYDSSVSDSCIRNEEMDSICEENQQQSKESVQTCREIRPVRKLKGRNVINATAANECNICPCGSKFSTRVSLDTHFSKHHHNPPFICGYCKGKFSDSHQWLRHSCSVAEGQSMVDIETELHCHYCSAVVYTNKKFDDHTRSKHFDSIVPYQCFQCEKRFPNATLRKLHFDADHGMPYCCICKKRYQDSEKCRHKSYHYGLGFPCHLCKTAYSVKYSLEEHMSKLHPFSKYNIFKVSCVQCNVQFPCSKALKLHRKQGSCKNSM